MVAAVPSGEVREALGNDALADGFAWIPDGSGLIVSSARGSILADPATYNLWAIPRTSRSPSQLTFGEDSYESPDASAQGNLVVSRVRWESDIWKFPTTGGPVDNARRGARVTRQTGQVQTVAVSPDDSEVAFLSDNGGHANIWVARVSDGEMHPLTHEPDPHGFGSKPTSMCWSDDGRWLYYSESRDGVFLYRKTPSVGGQTVTVPEHEEGGCIPDLYRTAVVTLASGALDLEISSTGSTSRVIGHVSLARIPGQVLEPAVSPDGMWLAMPLLDGTTTDFWALSTASGEWRKLTDFGARNVSIAGRIAWSKDGKYLYAAVSDIDSDILMFSGLKWR
jgi:Tol biopolymer transport system component